MNDVATFCDECGADIAYEETCAVSGQRHPCAGHPAAAVLADHKVAMREEPAAPARCICGWAGQSCDGPAHLANVLAKAGLLKEGE